MSARALSVVACLLTACGEGRPETAPRLPIPEIDAPCSEYDIGTDGSIDYVYQFTYDDEGFIVQYTGTPTDVGIFTYDKAHFILHFTQNYDADAAIDYEETYTRDKLGRILTYQQNEEGTLNGSQVTYDSSGRATMIVYTGSQPGTLTYTYNGSSIWPAMARAVYGNSATKSTYTTANDERTLHIDHDDGEDGTIDRTSDLRYNDERQILTSILRQNGTVYRRNSYAYDDRGLVTRSTESSSESGPEDAVYVSTYDSRGMRTMREVTSPSGQDAGAVYREVTKTTCNAMRMTSTVAPARRMSLRPSQHTEMFTAPPI